MKIEDFEVVLGGNLEVFKMIRGRGGMDLIG